MPLKTKTTDIPEAKIRSVIWMLKTGKTKKDCCKHLGIAYNTTRLNKIIEDFKNNEKRIAERKAAKKGKPLSEGDIEYIVSSYLDGEPMSKIATTLYIGPARVKKALIENNIPIRGRGKHSEAQVEHVVQDLDIKLSVKDKVFIPKRNTFGIVTEVWDEEHIEKLQNGYLKDIQLTDCKKDEEPRRGVHFETYMFYDNGDMVKINAVKELIASIEKTLEETGREYYRVYVGAYDETFMGPGHSYFYRKDLYPVK